MSIQPRAHASFMRERRIRFSDCDPAGIVFYPQYFVMLNGLVEDWVDDGLDIGFGRLVGERGIGLPTVRLEADFRAVSRMGDRVELSLAVERLGSRSITLDLHVAGDRGDVRMSVRQVLVTTSLVDHRAIDIPADLRAAIASRANPAAASRQPAQE
ncbi:thioesterase family protein [Piscinibacter sp. XHJ-5]|uniref:acyl-CoA thioesterase n=1 Tax=Piscinibacter sp. XHJ-5 TaxID=3037797 RepID=UPI002452E240|nr:thioesterase family protein [Piscinibacter sp. XHJ-5]